METDNNQDPTYVVGRSPEETERLKDQERFYGPITKRMLTDAGMHEGMHVLDVGCGAGDVALLAAELVGETGRVTAIDVNPDILVATRQRVAALGVNHIDFVEGDVRTHEFDDQFDAVIGRLTLMYMADPAVALRRVTSHLRPGGLVAFQELDMTLLPALRRPEMPLMTKSIDWFFDVFQQAGVHLGMGLDLNRVFVEAGLPEPAMHLEAPLSGDATWDGIDQVEQALRSILPLIEEYGIAKREEVDIDTWSDRVRQEIATIKRPAVMAPHVTAWTRVL